MAPTTAFVTSNRIRWPSLEKVYTARLACEPMARKQTGTARIAPKLSEAEQDLLSHLEHGFQLETDSLGSDPVLRRPKDGEVMRPVSANRNTVKALEELGLIVPAKSRDPLKLVWRVKRKANG